MEAGQLNKKRQAFVEHYLKCWNAAEAARKAGYSERTAYSSGPRLLRNVEVQAAIKERLESLKMGTDEAMMRLTEQARGTGARYIQWNGIVDMVKVVEDGKEHLIKGVKFDRVGNMVVEFYDAQAALDKVAKILGMYKPEVEMPDVSIHISGFEELLDKVYGNKNEEPNSD